MTRHRLAIVGGGPWCAYALERLAAELPEVPLPDGLEIAVFERTGRFGAGAAHDDRQPVTSYLNRVASQLSFAADESNSAARHLLPRWQRPTFAQWCRQRYEQTGDPRFDLRPQDVPRRYLHGLALREMFDRYVTALHAIDGVRVTLYPTEVLDVEEAGGAFRVRAAGVTVDADDILLVTGQSENRAAPGSVDEALGRHARRYPAARYVPSPYPLGGRLTRQTVPAGSRVGVLGMGLTAIDLILHLTEGRGGAFVPAAGELRPPALEYRPSGEEPARIVAISPSGLFPWCRPENQKAVDGTGAGHAALEHKPAFLTVAAVRALRASVGVPAVLPTGAVPQLDFERHLFPLVVLEMAYAYYRTLFGPDTGEQVRAVAQPGYRDFLRDGGGDRPGVVDRLLAPVRCWFDALAERVAAGTDAAAADAFRRTVYGDQPAGSRSPWGHSPDVRAHAFDWRALADPLGADGVEGPADWQRSVAAHLRRDLAAAAQGNLRNPVKAACDGVWRDLRPVFAEALDFGGLTAAAHRRFRSVYLRHYARMSNGTGLEPMRRILALVDSGLLDVSLGPDPVVLPVPGQPRYRLGSRDGRTVREVEIVVRGRGHPFDPLLDRGPLYRNLIARGLVRQWHNPGVGEPDYVPGALDVSRDFHPVDRHGRVDPRLTVLGAPVEGMVFFQLSAARPHADSGVVNGLARWANGYVDRLVEPAGAGSAAVPIDEPTRRSGALA